MNLRKLNIFLLLLLLINSPIVIKANDISPKVLLVYDGTLKYSGIDKSGISAALMELGIPYDLLNISTSDVLLNVIQNYPVVVLSELTLTANEIIDVTTYVNNGGGILATGKSAKGIEQLLGLTSYSTKVHSGNLEIRFNVEHSLSYGLYWNGASMINPPMPDDEIPTISQFVYPESSWPAYSANVSSGIVIANYYNANSWNSSKQEPAVIFNMHGNGRTVYSGPLPGVYNDPNWQWPFCWRKFITNVIEWSSGDEYLVEIGYWPNGYKSSFIWSGDTETAEMITAVPSILNIFDSLSLNNFGTFYVVGKAGGDAGTEGAIEHPEIVKMIAERGSEVGGHGNIHIGFSGASVSAQANRLQEMIDIINPLISQYGESCRGFRAPHVDIDRNTFKACAQVGLLYESSDIDVWSETTFPNFNKVWEAVPTMPMDWTLFINLPVSDDAAIEIYNDKIDYITAGRGMFNWVCHPWVIKDHLNVLYSVLEYVANKNIWMARQDSIIEWRRDRVKLKTVDASRIGNEIILTLKNEGDNKLLNASVWLKVTSELQPGEISASINNKSIPSIIEEHNNQKFLVATVPSIEMNSIVDVKFSTLPVSVESNSPVEISQSLIVYENSPNPFNPETTIHFEVKKTQEVEISVFDNLGQKITTLVDKQFTVGKHKINFNGNGLSSGIYFYLVKSGSKNFIKKMVYLK